MKFKTYGEAFEYARGKFGDPIPACKIKTNLIGRKFGKLTVWAPYFIYVNSSGKRDFKVICSCDCGGLLVTFQKSLASGRTASCGCAPARKRMRSDNHGDDPGTRHLVTIWKYIHSICNLKTERSRRYRRKGLRVCKEWTECRPFIEWAKANGYEFGRKMTRTSRNRGFSPGNCTWVDNPRNYSKQIPRS